MQKKKSLHRNSKALLNSDSLDHCLSELLDRTHWNLHTEESKASQPAASSRIYMTSLIPLKLLLVEIINFFCSCLPVPTAINQKLLVFQGWKS